MKTQLLLAIIASIIVSCQKENAYIPQSKTSQISFQQNTDPHIGTILKWKCLGGDTMFNDTLKMKLESVYLSPKQKSEILHFDFNFPVWTTTMFECSAQELQHITQLPFIGSDCKTTYFVRLN